MFFLHWRKMTWALWIWNAIFVIWIIAGISNRASKNCAVGDQLCKNASDAGTGIGVALIILLWFMGFIVLSFVWFMTRPRSRLCPKCGRDVKRGTTICGECGYEFGASFPERADEPPMASATSPVLATTDTAEALRQLDDLHTKNLISDEEYQAKRKAHLDRL